VTVLGKKKTPVTGLLEGNQGRELVEHFVGSSEKGREWKELKVPHSRKDVETRGWGTGGDGVVHVSKKRKRRRVVLPGVMYLIGKFNKEVAGLREEWKVWGEIFRGSWGESSAGRGGERSF